MEIEAKFTIPDQDTMNRLQSVIRLGDYRLTASRAHPQRITDHYLDTAAQTLYHSGYACRIRNLGSMQTLGVKGLGESEGAIHRRVEVEAPPAAGLSADPQTWPPSEARDLICTLIQDEPLVELFTVEQNRLVRPLKKQGRQVASMSIDDVCIKAAGNTHIFWEIEIELTANGSLDDLHTLTDHLTETWGMAPDTLSKFHRGLALLERSDVLAGPGQLSAAERAELAYIAEHAPQVAIRDRAQLILDWASGVAVRESFSALGRSKSWAYTWIERFKTQHMDIFRPALIAQAREHSGLFAQVAAPPPDVSETAPDVEPRPAEHRVSLDELYARFQVDMIHARCVADHALALFDGLATIHRLPARYRPLLETMALLHNVGLETDAARHHTVGRDIILEHPLEGLDDQAQQMIAASVYLHRKPIKPKRLRAQVIAALPPDLQQDVLALSSLIRIADGLDYTQGQTTRIDGIEATPVGAFLQVSGPYADLDAARAEAKSDLWEYCLGRPLLISIARPDQQPIDEASVFEMTDLNKPAELPARVALPLNEWPPSGDSPGLSPDDSMSEAGRKILYFHFWRMLNNEAGTREGTDIEALHDMRVATRRMRSAIDVFGRYFKRGVMPPFELRLRRTARLLGQVRDLDVLVEKAQIYLGTLAPENAHDLDPLLERWQFDRAQARAKLIAYLDSAKYIDWVRAFGQFLTTPGAGARKLKGFPPKPAQVRHIAPALLYTRWARVWAFEPLMPQAAITTLHALRIECKRLRYALEFFREVLGPDAEAVIARVVRLQDHLGNLHDADVANTLLSEFLFSARPGIDRLIAPGVVTYLAFQQRELEMLLETFGHVWDDFDQPRVRQWLANAVAAL